MLLKLIRKDFILFCKIFLFLTVVGFLRRTVSIKQLLQFIYPKRIKEVKVQKKFIDNLVAFTEFFKKNIPWFKPACLTKSLVYFKFLNEAGIKARIHFGIKSKNLKQLKEAGHSWVTVNGKIFPEDDCKIREEFLSVYSFP